ncbi:MAG: hypothetical protein HC774_07875 [Sphingomonadales bacterium]|nr:hypothetical protein [Sphingomonadales bacterium]
MVEDRCGRQRIQPRQLEQGVLWNRRNTFVILGNRKRSLVDDYNHRRINFSNVCMVELEAFGFCKHAASAAICATAPVAALVYFAMFGFHPNAATGDKILQLIIVMLWLRYSWRILQIAQAYPTMPEPKPEAADESE